MIAENLYDIKKQLPSNVTLVAVSKTKPSSMLLQAFEAGQLDFGENYVQELVNKYEELPKDIRWHMIGHLQSNKVKYIAPFVYLIHGIDSLKLLKEVNKQAQKCNRIINVLLQVHIAVEETKFGFDPDEVLTLLKSGELNNLNNVCVKGLMTMGSNTEDEKQIEQEFLQVKQLFDEVCKISDSESQISNLKSTILSMGMSGDFKLAVKCGSTMVRIGSLIFGERNYSNN